LSFFYRCDPQFVAFDVFFTNAVRTQLRFLRMCIGLLLLLVVCVVGQSQTIGADSNTPLNDTGAIQNVTLNPGVYLVTAQGATGVCV
jgi:hypothetical protein